MFRTVANKNGTIEVNGNEYRFSQPVEDYRTEDTIEIENSYMRKLEFIGDDPYYVTAHNVELRNGQVIFEYSLEEIKMFDYLRTLFLKQKIYYYRSLIEIAKRAQNGEVHPLWQKENFVIDTNDHMMKTLIIEHDEFSIQDNKDPLVALKELIIISLTSMNRVLGKPRRADFLEQNEEVIRFAEKIYLKARTIEEIDEFINAEIYYMELQQKEKEAQQAQKGKVAILKEKAQSKIKKQPTSKKDKGNQELISKLQGNTDNNTKKEKKNLTKKQKDMRLYGSLGAVLVGAILLNVILNNVNEQASANTENGEEEINQEEQIIELYRDSFFEDNGTTIEKIEEIGYENLENEEDKAILEQLYILTGQYDVALELNPETASDIAQHMYQNEEAEVVDEFVSFLEIEKTPEVNFYHALAMGNWELAIEEKDNLELDGSKSNLLLTAYFKQENVIGAEEFLSTIEPTEAMQERLTLAQEKQNSINKAQDELSNLQDDLDDADKDDKKKINNRIDDKEDEISAQKDELKNL